MKTNTKILLSVLVLIGLVTGVFLMRSSNNKEDDKQVEKVLKIHKGKFAFCGASGAVPTGRKIKVQGK